MKKLLLSFSALFIAFCAFGQSQRLVLVEQFTQASCGPCAVYNPALNNLLDANPEKVIAIKYQTSWPGVDPMNAHNPTQVRTRVDFYGVSSVPNAQVDGGIAYAGHTQGINGTVINNRYADSSPFTVDVDFQLSPNRDSIHAHARITASQNYTGTNLVAHVVVIERNIYFATAPGSNGEKKFEGVMKRMLPTDAGTPINNTWTSGDQIDLNYSWLLANIYDKNQLAVVVFVQDNTSKEVLQAGYMSPRIFNDAGVTAVTGVPYQCTSDVTPVLTLKNFGIDPLTSCDINYSYDNNPIQTISWTGNLASNATTTYTMPTQTLTSGPHTFTAYTSNPNANIDLDTNNNRTTKRYNLFTTAVATPVSNNFVATTFPNFDFVVENVNNDAYQWARSPYGFNGSGSARMDCYNAASGTIDNLMTPKVDFSNALSSAQLTFDLAHRMYSATAIERLKVNVSTDCGATWTTLYNKSGATLATVSGYLTSQFNPVSTSWRTETVSLGSYAGAPELMIQFQSISGYGNHIYVDNINITDGTASVPVLSTISPVELYPNPARGEVYLNVNLEKATDLNVTIINSLGAKVASYAYDSFASGVIRLDISTLAKGNYVVSVGSADGVVTKRLMVSE